MAPPKCQGTSSPQTRECARKVVPEANQPLCGWVATYRAAAVPAALRRKRGHTRRCLRPLRLSFPDGGARVSGTLVSGVVLTGTLDGVSATGVATERPWSSALDRKTSA